jgi:hypothetical protein
VQSKKEGHTFKEGDYIWLEGHNLHLDVPSAKLAPKHHGPFPIKRVLSPITYQLTLPGTWRIHDVFHVDLLTPYIKTEFHGPNYTRPPPDLIQGEEEYKVKKVLDSRQYGRGHKVQYLVKWKGYPDSDNEWVNWNDMHADEALEEFRQCNPLSRTHKSTLQTTMTEPPPLSQLSCTLMSNNATVLSTTTDTQSEGQQSPTSGTEELVRDSLVTAGLINIPTASDFCIGYRTSDTTRSPWFEPSSWQTPSSSPSREPSASPLELTECSYIMIPQTLIPTDFVHRTLDAAQSWESAYRALEGCSYPSSWNYPFCPYPIPYHITPFLPLQSASHPLFRTHHCPTAC